MEKQYWLITYKYTRWSFEGEWNVTEAIDESIVDWLLGLNKNFYKEVVLLHSVRISAEEYSRFIK